MLADIDQRLLRVLCAHRVVTQNQLARLFPGVPERTLRYRTRRLHQLGLAGRSRPYRERGSTPNHHWPTRRADCLMRGDPAPRGGERRQPNPIFLAHAAALTGLYVALTTQAETLGLSLHQYFREGDAREPFTHSGRERALAPDALVILTDKDGHMLGAFVEIDLGTMSHTRLRQKAELYAAYTKSDAWEANHPYLPALLFLTTTSQRAGKFLKALAQALAYGPRQRVRHPFVAAAAGIAWTPGQLTIQSCLADLDGNTSLSLLDVLNTARVPYEQALAYRREQEQANKQRLRTLREDPLATRQYLNQNRHALAAYTQALGATGETAIELLLASTSEPSPDERSALRAIAHDLDHTLLEPHTHTMNPPGATVKAEIALLAQDYARAQARQIDALARQHPEGPSLRAARKKLSDGGLLDALALNQIPYDAQHDENTAREQREMHDTYMRWREQAARQLARQAGPLRRLTRHPEDFYDQLDQEHLRTCGRCHETIYPHKPSSHQSHAPHACHYCRASHSTHT
jgi:hypothetical protein